MLASRWASTPSAFFGGRVCGGSAAAVSEVCVATAAVPVVDVLACTAAATAVVLCAAVTICGVADAAGALRSVCKARVCWAAMTTCWQCVITIRCYFLP